MKPVDAGTQPSSVWQVSAGPSNRSYADVLLRHGVALIGPGDAGPWTTDKEDEEFDGGYVRRFASEIEAGDVLVLRTGRATILAAGIVVGDYQHLMTFDDVNGWDLQHARRVRWSRPLPSAHTFEGTPFGNSPARISRVQNEDVLDFAARFLKSPPTDWQSAPLPPLPPEEPRLATVPQSLRELVAQTADLFPLYLDEAGFGERPTEDELVAHFVVPLLRSLGWPTELLAVEWRDIDIAVFSRLPRTPDNCAFIIEAKRLGAGVEGALEQARGYVTSLGVDVDVVVTDGVRYRLYDGRRDFAPIAYANLDRLKQSAAELFTRLQRP